MVVPFPWSTTGVERLGLFPGFGLVTVALDLEVELLLVLACLEVCEVLLLDCEEVLW